MTTLEAQHEVITNLILENKKLKQERDEAREDAAKYLWNPEADQDLRKLVEDEWQWQWPGWNWVADKMSRNHERAFTADQCRRRYNQIFGGVK